MAIWYNHWLQLRWRTLTSLALVLVISAASGWRRLEDGIAFLDRTGQLPGILPRFVQPLHHLSGASILTWSLLMDHVWMAFWMVPLILVMGTNLTARNATSPPYFMFSLPTSRYRLVWTRFIANSGMLLLLGYLTAGFLGIWLTWQNYGVPWQLVAYTIGLAWLGMLPSLAGWELLNAAFEPRAAYAVIAVTAFLPYLIFNIWMMRFTANIIASPGDLRTLLMLSLGGAFGMMAIAAWITRAKEY